MHELTPDEQAKIEKSGIDVEQYRRYLDYYQERIEKVISEEVKIFIGNECILAMSSALIACATKYLVVNECTKELSVSIFTKYFEANKKFYDELIKDEIT